MRSTTKIDTSRSFGTSFALQISKPTDGVALVFQSQGPKALGAEGGGIWYGARPSDTAAPRIQPSVAVEIDTWDNSPDGFDPAGRQHIAVTTNGDITNHLVWRDPGFDMRGNQPVYLWLSYDAGAELLTVFAGQTTNGRQPPCSPIR